MASITISIGGLSSSIPASDAKANVLVTQYGAAIGASGSNQAKLDAVVRALVRHMQQQAAQHVSVTAQTSAAATAKAEVDALWWDVASPAL